MAKYNKNLTLRIIPPQYVKTTPVLYTGRKYGGSGVPPKTPPVSTPSSPGQTLYVTSGYVTSAYVTTEQP
jgi:hypothetical protein